MGGEGRNHHHHSNPKDTVSGGCHLPHVHTCKLLPLFSVVVIIIIIISSSSGSN